MCMSPELYKNKISMIVAHMLPFKGHLIAVPVRKVSLGEEGGKGRSEEEQ